MAQSDHYFEIGCGVPYGIVMLSEDRIEPYRFVIEKPLPRRDVETILVELLKTTVFVTAVVAPA